MPASTSNVVTTENAKQSGKAQAYTDQQAGALGKLRAFGDVLGTDSRLQGREASQVGQIGGFERGSSAVLPYELEAANNKGAGMKLLGDILGGVGSVGMSAGLGGGKFAGFGAAAAPTGSNVASMALARAADRASVPGYSAPLRFNTL